jgi:hypothetical protein
MELAVELDMRYGPESLHDSHLFSRALASIVEILIETDELKFIPADSNAEPKPSSRQLVHRGCLFRNQHRLPLLDEHPGGEADLIGTAGEEPEQHERVVIGIRCGADAAVIFIECGSCRTSRGEAAIVRVRIGTEH